jgi:thiopurine S-methyltransferase
MDEEYWHQKWQERDIGFNQSLPNKLMQRYFSTLQLAPGSRVLVPLCGQSIDMLWLASQGYQVIGVEISSIACSAFFIENKIPVKIKEIDNFTLYSSEKITLFSGDFFKLDNEILGEIDGVYDRAALIALPDNIRKSYARHLTQLMVPDTKMLLITTSYDQNEMQGPPFSVEEREIRALYETHFEIKTLYRKQFDVPPHLKRKGLLQATENVYVLVRQNGFQE